MSLEVIYVTRHGFRSNWAVDSKTGVYSTSIPSPTGIPSDPALTGHGVVQSHELAAHLISISPPVERIYSSPYYRCLQTISPTAAALSALHPSRPEISRIRGENGIAEWYGSAPFNHPSPADSKVLKDLFEYFDESYQPMVKPSVRGETVEELHDRAARALESVIEQADREGLKTIVLCTHAATLIAIGRVLTGRMPQDIGEEDFHPFTCSLSTFVRKDKGTGNPSITGGQGSKVGSWRDGSGVGGGWNMTVDGDCSFLSGGEERGWRFSGDESFFAASDQEDAGTALGVVVERRTTGKTRREISKSYL
ncbi:histidine phosphatase superfamily [Bisporella sp. PMI_857]|nr:histidine phosphatase superfamily [Bisporella sp. PMI_857]